MEAYLAVGIGAGTSLLRIHVNKLPPSGAVFPAASVRRVQRGGRTIIMTNDSSTGTILVAIDGSHNSMLAAGVGARLAKLLGVHLGLVHVLELPTLGFWGRVEARMKDEIRAQAEQRLGEIAEKMRKACDITPGFYILEGLPEDAIPRLANEDGQVLMVVAGRQGLATEKQSHLRLRRGAGRLTPRFTEQLRVPLLVVPPDVPLSHICPALAEMQDVPPPDA